MITIIKEEIRQYIEYERFKWKIKKNTPKEMEKEVKGVLQWLYKIK